MRERVRWRVVKKGSSIIISARGELSDNGCDRVAVKRTCTRTTTVA